MRATAIIPVKRFGVAKQRLLEALDRPGRAALVKAMLADVLAATAGAELIERVIVVTGERRAERIALRRRRTPHRAARGLPRSPGPRPLGGGDAGDRPRQGARGRLRRPAARGLPAARPGRARRGARAACGAAGWRSCPTATAPAPTRSCSRRRTRSARPSVRIAAPVMPIARGAPGTRVAVEPLDSLGARRRHARRPRRARRGAGASAPPRPRDGRRAGATGSAQGRRPSMNDRLEVSPGARPARDRHRRPARRADRATARQRERRAGGRRHRRRRPEGRLEGGGPGPRAATRSSPARERATAGARAWARTRAWSS